MYIVELCLLITFWTSTLVSILYCDLITILRWIVELEQASGLHGVIRWVQLVLGVFIDG